jgi:hypothetical protein
MQIRSFFISEKNSCRAIDAGGFGVSIEKMSTEDYDPVFALRQATPGIRLGSADRREAMDPYLLRNPGMSFSGWLRQFGLALRHLLPGSAEQ